MPQSKELVGARFGRLLVMAEAHPRVNSGHKIRMLQVKCDCGNVRVVQAGNLRNGHTKSCGCLSLQSTAERSTVHGMAKKSGAWKSWVTIRDRCENANDPAYKNYGARGITVCERWRDFRNFFADMGERPSGASIDRIDNEGSYEPNNCRWASRTEQARNKRNNINVTIDGVTRCLADVAAERGIKYRTAHARIVDRGWDAARALTTPVKQNQPRR